jgi:putative endonuclease
MTNKKNWTLYIWVTRDIIHRVYQHKEWLIEWFTQKYDLKQPVYYEIYETIAEAIQREKQLKAWNRKKKVELIESFNNEWNDLYSHIVE